MIEGIGRAARPRVARSQLRGPPIEGKDKAILCARIADEAKAKDIIILDLRGISEVTDYFVICTATNPRQLRALHSRIREELKKLAILPLGEDGAESTQWVLLDYNDVIVHIFHDEFRDFYDLELLWGDAPRIEWQAVEKA